MSVKCLLKELCASFELSLKSQKLRSTFTDLRILQSPIPADVQHNRSRADNS